MNQRLLPYLFGVPLLLTLLVTFLLPTKHAAATDDARAGTDPFHLYAPLVMKPSTIPAPNPLTVSVTLDQSHVVTGTIAVEGGDLNLTAPDGKQFTLAIPANALLSPQEITMTLLSGVEGLPLSGGLRAGVHLEPEGLQLFKAATLTISGVQPPASDLHAVGFGYHGLGSEFHLRPADESGTTYTLDLMHFSGYGVTTGTESEIATQIRQHPPTQSADWYAQESVVNQGDRDLLLRWWNRLNNYWFGEALNSEVALLFSLTEMTRWEQAIREAGLADTEPFKTNIEVGWESLGFILYATSSHAYDKCTAHDASQVVKMMRWVYIAQSIPALGLIDRDDLMPEMQEKARKCATFELDFDSTVTASQRPPYPMTGRVRAEGIQLQMNPDGASFIGGTGPLNYVSFTHGATDESGLCTFTSTTRGSTFQVTEARFNLNISDLDYRASEIPEITLGFNPGDPAEFIRMVCRGGEGVWEPMVWDGYFQVLHLPELRGENFIFGNWRFVGGELYAEKITERSASAGADLHGTSFMVLVHTPQ